VPQRDVVVIGASAGGVEALRHVIGQLPADLPAAVLVVLHVPASAHSALPRILRRAGRLPAEHARDGEPILPGHVYVAPPDRHLIVADDTVRLSRGPRENGYRPAVDVLFRSTARAVTSRAIAVVLSGALDDGAAGAQMVLARGGTLLVQDPEDALYPGMPSNTLAVCEAQYTGDAESLGRELVRLSGTDAPVREDAAPRELRMEADMAELDQDTLDDPDRPGVPSGFSCPDCQGGLFELSGTQIRYRCRVGHAWTGVSLMAQQDAGLEHALWMALRSLEEKAALARRMATGARLRGSERTAQHYEESAKESLSATGRLRSLLLGQPQVTADLIEPLVADDGATPDGTAEKIRD
jgi:two-component system chemotaxis response regulator CheB